MAKEKPPASQDKNWTRKMREDWDQRARTEEAVKWFSWTGPDLDSSYSGGKDWAGTLLQPALERLGFNPTGKRILDIGCGFGRLFPGFAELGFQEIGGIDISAEMLDRGRKFCPVPQARFVHGSGEDLEGIDSNYFDYCFSYGVFESIPKERVLWRYLDEVHRVLRSGGAFQLHFRATTPLKTKILRSIPVGLQPAAQAAYQLLTPWRLRGNSITSIKEHYPPGNLKTWVGAAVSPQKVARRLTRLGFIGVGILPDPSYKTRGARFWAIGRKP